MERFLLLTFAVILVGCGDGSAGSGRPKAYPATGVVTLNGRPLEGATVNFYPMEGTAGSAIGLTDSSGKYQLTTFTSGDGALPGQYKVSIVKHDAASGPKPQTLPAGQLASGDIDASYAPPSNTTGSAQPSAPKNEIPEKYSNQDTSGLRGLIESSGENVNNFDLK